MNLRAILLRVLSAIINIFVCQVFQANSDRHTIVTNTFPRSVLASYIRVHPQLWYSWVSMRVEFIGCPIGEYPRATTAEKCTKKRDHVQSCCLFAVLVAVTVFVA